MPTYEYACTSCGEHLEIVQSFRDEPLNVCSSCGGPLRKVFGAIGVVFKGSGFYKTDSRPASKTATGEKADKTSESAGKTSDSSGSKSAEGSGSSTSEKTGKSSASGGSSSKPSSGAAAS